MKAASNIPTVLELGADSRSEKILSQRGERPGSNFTVAFGKQWESISRYGDTRWDFSAYNFTTGYSEINFEAVRNSCSKNYDRNVAEIKWLLFLYISNNDRGRGGILSPSTVISIWKLTLRRLLEHCSTKGIEVRSVFEQESEFLKYIDGTNLRTALPGFSSLVSILIRLGESVTGYKVFPQRTLEKMRLDNKHSNDREQTRVIPTRILSHSIASNTRVVNEYNEYSQRLTEFFEAVKTVGNSYARPIASQQLQGIKAADRELEFIPAIRKHKLEELCDSHNIVQLCQFTRYLKTVQYSAKTLIHVFSGMRDSEALNLSYDCLVSEVIKRNKILLIVGKTTKLEATKRDTSWVTKKYQAHSITINEGDVEELVRINPLRGRDTCAGIDVGESWNFHSHQYRRSLAFYAAQSGLVSLPSLKRQLKHITREMTVYYAAGSSVSREIFTTRKGHVIDEFQEVKPEADAVAYLFNLLLSDEELYGPLGRNLEKSERCKSKLIILESRDALIKRFRRGELAYKETPTGVCMSTEPCHKRAMRSIAACMDCSSAVIKKPNLMKVIKKQDALIDRLEDGSMEKKMEMELVEDLKRCAVRIRAIA